LLAKTADGRCQTAAWVEADLSRCLGEFLAHGRLDPFPLNAHDTPHRLLIPEILYGRENAIDALGAAFNQVVTFGTIEVVLVSGYAGIGKSSLVNELRRMLVRSRPRPPPAQSRSRCGLDANASPQRICPKR
jgi:AAA ATPase domain